MLLLWALLASPLTLNSPRTPADARDLMHALRNQASMGKGDCATMDVLAAQQLMQREDPDRTLLADVQIHGAISEYSTDHFIIRYTKEATVDQPPMGDTGGTWPLPDGTTFTVAANGTPDYIEKAARYLEYARATYIVLGYPATANHMEVRVIKTFASYSLPLIGIVLSHDSSDWRLPFLCAHELFHQVEWAYFPGDVALAVVRLQNPKGYDTFATEGSAQVGGHYIFNHDYGSDMKDNADDYQSNTDVDFYDQAYDSSEFWLYMVEQLATSPSGKNKVMQRFWNERAFHSTEDAIARTASAFGSSSTALIDAFRVAIALKGHFNVDPTVPGPSRAFDFVEDGADNWEAVTLKRQLNVDEAHNVRIPGSIEEDGGAHYYRVIPGTAQTFALRVTAASDDVRVQIVRVTKTSREVTIDRFTTNDGSINKTVDIPSNTLALYVILASSDGTQPYDLAFNPIDGNKPPDLNIPMFCGSAVPVGTPQSGRDTAAAIQMGFLMFITLLASRRYRGDRPDRKDKD